ncbi:MAG: hypothetical protein P8181_10455, partial [bacterium]
MSKKSTLIVSVFILSMIALYSSNCTNQPTMTDAGSPQWSTATIPPDPLNDRPNPLREHIRTNWTGGDPDDTGGLHYGHIKIAGLNFTNMGTLADGDDQAEFVVDHFDLYTWGGSVVGEHADGQYMDFIWLLDTIGIPFVRNHTEPDWWLNDSELNPEGYTFDDLVMHYKYDGTSQFLDYYGWNPADDTNGDGCREDSLPSDPNRTAECITDAEILHYVSGSAQPWWNFAKVMHDGYLK